jgi:hypothetical protein
VGVGAPATLACAAPSLGLRRRLWSSGRCPSLSPSSHGDVDDLRTAPAEISPSLYLHTAATPGTLVAGRRPLFAEQGREWAS